MDWNFIIFSIVKIAIVDRRGSGVCRLRGSGRAENFGVDSGSRRAEPRRAAVYEIHSGPRADADALGNFSTAGRRFEIHAQGRFHPGGRAQSVFLAGTDDFNYSLDDCRCGDSIRFVHRPSKNGHRGFERGNSLHVWHCFASAFMESCSRATRRIQNIRSSVAFVPARK